MTEDDVRSLLRELRDEPVPPDSLARVRLGVAERVRKTGWTGLGWRAFWAASAVVVILLGVAFIRVWSPPEVAMLPVVYDAPSPPAFAHQRTEVVAKPRAKVRREPPPDAGVVVRIETEDPDVVILLIGD